MFNSKPSTAPTPYYLSTVWRIVLAAFFGIFAVVAGRLGFSLIPQSHWGRAALELLLFAALFITAYDIARKATLTSTICWAWLIAVVLKVGYDLYRAIYHAQVFEAWFQVLLDPVFVILVIGFLRRSIRAGKPSLQQSGG
jgi:hypothetical protein